MSTSGSTPQTAAPGTGPASGRHAPTGPRAERKRRAILAAARTVFLREGFDASVDLVAAEAGVSKVTVYNHFGSKQALFVEVIKDSVDAPLEDSLGAAVDGLSGSGDLRTAFVEAARAWVAGVRADPDALAMRALVAREAHRVPELQEVWQQGGPRAHHPVVREALEKLTAAGRLDIPDPELAIIQLYSLLLFPHLVFSTYGSAVDDEFAERMITGGVDMFLARYAPRGA